MKSYEFYEDALINASSFDEMLEILMGAETDDAISWDDYERLCDIGYPMFVC